MDLWLQVQPELARCVMPRGLQTPTLGDCTNQSLEVVTLLCVLQTFTFGAFYDQSLQVVTLPSSLQTVTFGHSFPGLGRCHLPSGLHVTKGHLSLRDTQRCQE